MPMIEYMCENCNHHFDHFKQTESGKEVEECPQCHECMLRRMFGPGDVAVFAEKKDMQEKK